MNNLWIQAYKEMLENEELAYNHQVPGIQETVKEAGLLPHEVLFLGACNGFETLLVNTHDPSARSILYIADCGKTDFLKCLTVADKLFNENGSYNKFTVFSNRVKEWEGYKTAGGFYEPLFDQAVLALASYAHSKSPTSKEVDLLLLDNPEFNDFEFDTMSNLLWLLDNGAKRRTWVITTTSWKNYQKYHDTYRWYKTPLVGTDLTGISEQYGYEKARTLEKNWFYVFSGGKWIECFVPEVRRPL